MRDQRLRREDRESVCKTSQSSKRSTSVVFCMLLLLCGDILLNPGPVCSGLSHVDNCQSSVSWRSNMQAIRPSHFAGFRGNNFPTNCLSECLKTSISAQANIKLISPDNVCQTTANKTFSGCKPSTCTMEPEYKTEGRFRWTFKHT